MMALHVAGLLKTWLLKTFFSAIQVVDEVGRPVFSYALTTVSSAPRAVRLVSLSKINRFHISDNFDNEAAATTTPAAATATRNAPASPTFEWQRCAPERGAKRPRFQPAKISYSSARSQEEAPRWVFRLLTTVAAGVEGETPENPPRLLDRGFFTSG